MKKTYTVKYNSFGEERYKGLNLREAKAKALRGRNFKATITREIDQVMIAKVSSYSAYTGETRANPSGRTLAWRIVVTPDADLTWSENRVLFHTY